MNVVELGLRRLPVLLSIFDQQITQTDDGIDRRPELVRHVGEKPRLHFVRAAKMVGLLVEFGVERDDTAVGIFQFAIQSRELFLLARAVVLVERLDALELRSVALHRLHRVDLAHRDRHEQEADGELV